MSDKGLVGLVLIALAVLLCTVVAPVANADPGEVSGPHGGPPEPAPATMSAMPAPMADVADRRGLQRRGITGVLLGANLVMLGAGAAMLWRRCAVADEHRLQSEL